ncbi:MAG: glycosyltransferase [Acutalibacteraceae bacterium]|nr:glycosyltransferase [Acutalibacteraceae bacterium]
MNLINKFYIKFKNNKIRVIRKNNTLHIINNTEVHGFVLFPMLQFGKNHKNVCMNFRGEVIKGNGAVLQMLNLSREIKAETSFNSSSVYNKECSNMLFAIKINRQSEVVVTAADIFFSNTSNNIFDDIFHNILDSGNDTLIVTPSYPTEENKYFGGFVHSRVKAYQDFGIKFDLICAHQYPNTCNYEFEGIKVTRTDFFGLRQLLTKKKYKTILLHFFDDKYAQVLDACDISNTNLYFWVHGPETLYWDWSKMTDNYFTPETELSQEYIDKFKNNDKLINRYNNYKNVHWVFVSEWIKKHSEELIGIKFNNSIVIPNFIDENNFDFVEKNPELRKKIFFVRRFENISKYAIDINVRTILELSRRDCFNNLEFNIYGTGENYDTLIAPIKDFPNVHLYQKFLNHSEISEVHKHNGIGLFATRYDAQGVSMCEAAMSGLAIVSSQNDAIAEFLPSELGILCDTEDYLLYADLIEKMYNDEEYFIQVSKACHKKVFDKCSFEKTIKREIEMIQSVEDYHSISIMPNIKTSEKLLSIIIPSYNVSDYLYHGVYTMLEHRNGNKIEVIIVNDGSKDNTVIVAEELLNRYSDNTIKILDKDNGGHGSTINEGLKLCSGKYIRIIDGDDWVNSEEMANLIDILECENADIVVTDYSEDIATVNKLELRKLYGFMLPGKKYIFDDLCYNGYGFEKWGPILATSSFKREVIVDSFKLTEKSFYIDMEFDAFSIEKAKNIVYYPLDIYRYFIGRIDQSISKNSYKNNYKQHENVIFNLINYYYNSNISVAKKSYILTKLIIPMITAHYVVVIQYWKSGKKYIAFEKRLSAYPEIYNHHLLATKMKKIHRKTGGILIRFDSIIKSIVRKLVSWG